ncbi:MAG TPA: 2-dehydropantoate 2-reductase [Burkholderiales bacterium]|jgi:2-dehydropantoate 2-reductase|nr:2-dehydropantoate 2-reductase [Burkholderiales bacterium]
MRILFLGAGGIGGLVGGRLAQHGADVTFLVREKRQAQLEADGLRIESPQGDAQVKVKTLLKSQVGADYDLVVLTAKAYDLDDAIDTLRPALAGEAAILPLLNGIAHIELLNREFGAARVLGGTARMQVTLTPEGVVRQLNDWQTVTFGEQDGSESARLQTFKALLTQTGIEAKLSTNIMRELWLKLVHLATVASATCAMRANLGEIARTPEGTAMLLRLLETNAEIAAQAGHRPDEKFLQTYRDLFATRDAKYEASMLRDLEKGGRIESEQVIGYMLQRCRAAGLPDAMLLMAYTHVKAYEQRRDAGRLPAHPAGK